MTDRGRVPFALIGVLLLVSSATLAMPQGGPLASEPPTEDALDGLVAESNTAIRAAVRSAARDAARRPLLERGNTTVGRRLNASQPFVDALRLRIYLRVREHLRRISGERRGLSVRASLPPIEDEAAVRRAIERIRVERAGPAGRSIRVSIADLRLRTTRDGRVVGRATRNPTVVVRTPVLEVHRRVQRFQQRLDARLGQPGLATQLTAVLYPVAWARGYGQFAGRPIENVVANRHLAVVTNGAVLGLQRQTFGRADPLGRRVYARALAETVATELVQATNSSALARLQRLRERVGHREAPADTLRRLQPPPDAPGPNETMTASIGRTADLAFVEALNSLDRTLNRTYRPAVRVRADVRRLDRSVRRQGSRGQSRLETFTTTSTTVADRPGSPPTTRAGWHRLLDASRTVTVTRTRVTTWALSGNNTTTTSRTVRRTYAVDLAVAGDHTVGPAPAGPINGVHERGGPFDGPNLADVRSLARQHVADRGGFDELAARAATGALERGPHRLQAGRPAALTARARPDLVDLRQRIRAISVEVRRGRVATFEANVPRLLAERLRDRRPELVDAPASYGSVARRARVGVRADYVDRVIARLERAAAGHERGRARLDRALPDTTRSPSALLAAGRRAGRASPRAAEAPIPMYVDAAPSYLTLGAVDHDSVPAIPPGRTEHPLVARNLNAFALPTDEAVEWLFGLLDGPERTMLRSAAQVYRTAQRAEDLEPTNTSRRRLRAGLQRASGGYRHWLASTLESYGLGRPDSRLEVVDEALDRWPTPGARAAAIANGSAAEAVHAAAVDRWPDRLEEPYERDLLEIDLATTTEEARSEAFMRPAVAPANETATTIRDALRARLESRAKAALKRRAAALAARVPMGVPVLPAPGLWYAMVNAWHVQVRGSYARFVVRVPRGAPDRLPADVRYVRENATVSLDVDDDGRPERLGRNRRIRFSAETVVAVAVPPKPRGVGDVGTRDERSPGWPDPGPVADDEK